MWIGFLFVFISAVVGGGINSVAVKLGISQMPPLTFTTLRFIFSTLFFLPIYLYQKPTKLYKKDMLILGAMSLFFATNLALFSIGLQFTSAIVSQTLYIVSPMLVITFAHFLIGEKFSRQKAIGLIISFVGVFYFVYQSAVTKSALTFGTPFGNILILIGVVCFSLYIVTSRKLTHSYSPATITMCNFIVTTVVLALCVPIEWHFRPFVITKINYVGIFSLGAMVFSSIVGYLTLQMGIKRTSAFIGSLNLYISPFFTALTAIIVLGEKVTVPFILGGALVAAGTLYATAYEHTKKLFGKTTALEEN